MRRMLFGKRAQRDQRGVILVMAVPGLVLAMVATALSVDIGRQVLEKRDDQKVADLAALDAARDIANAQAAAEASAVRNGFDPSDPGHSLVAEVGSVDAANTFTPGTGADAVRVTVTSGLNYIFRPGGQTLTAEAVATVGDAKVAGFKIGTSLASVDTSRSALLNAVLGSMIGGTADIVSWKGLVSSHVTVDALREELELLDAGVQFGTVDQMLASDVTLAELATATANALDKQGDANAALYFGPTGIIARMTNTATFTLGDLMQVEQGAGDAALASRIDAFGLLTGSAQVANGTNAVNVPNVGVTIPGVTSTSLSLQVIEGPRWVFGPVGAETEPPLPAQVRLTVTPTLDLPISVLGLVNPRVTGTFPLRLEGAGAYAKINSITCPDPNGGMQVGVDTQPIKGSATSTLRVSSEVLLVGRVPLVDIPTIEAVPETTPAHTDLDFSYPGEFSPTATGKQAGTSPVGLQALTTVNQNGDPVLLGALSVPIGDVVAATYAALPPVIGNVDTAVVTPLLEALGITVGSADVAALKDAFSAGCAAAPYPALAG